MQPKAFHVRPVPRLRNSSSGRFVRARILIGVCLLCFFAIALAAQTPSSQDVEVVRTETDLTNLLFIATDKSNRYITTLKQEDVRVLEDGVPQTLFTFQRETDRPLAIAFLIDVSGSEERTLPDEKRPPASSSKTLFDPTRTRRRLSPSKVTRTWNNL